MNSSRTVSAAGFLVILFFCYLAFFWRLGDYGLWDPDEGRSGVIAKGIVASGNLLTLNRAGEPYYDKPPLYFWLVALGLKLLGPGEVAVRLPSALAASLTVGAVFLFAAALRDWRWGLWSGVVLATSMEFVALGRFGNTDMVFTSFLTAALLYLLWWLNERRGRRVWPFYLFMALAALTKGPVGILLPCLVLAISLAWNRRWAVWREMRAGQGLAVILAVAGPWYVLAGFEDPAYIWTFLWKHNVLRFFISQPGIDHAEPFYYLFLVLLGGFLPWVLFLPAVGEPLWKEREETRDFLLVWAATVVFFFTLSHNKLGTYILPAFPPLALLTGEVLSNFVSGLKDHRIKPRWIAASSLLWLTLLLVIFPLTEIVFGPRYAQLFSVRLPLWPAAIFLGLSLAASMAGKDKILPVVVSVSALWLVGWFYKVKAPEVSTIRSGQAMAQLISTNGDTEVRIAAFHADSFAYYLAQPVQVVSHPGEVEELLSEPIPTVALVKDKHLSELAGLPQSRLFVWRRVRSGNALVANFPVQMLRK